ncbi:MAG: hypothetical protein IPN91_14170 [Holophagaceae bacterium]|uniref:Uncharacterized protein n=1 Tax=Candidatus Geothrix odensensis TaxID=2954440 RepID=A0A936F4T1_9BACT|nr:hypothetical protein [Candidatus Geothrix odensensis]
MSSWKKVSPVTAETPLATFRITSSRRRRSTSSFSSSAFSARTSAVARRTR